MTKQSLTLLKTLVFSMGLILIGGMVLLGGVVWKKATYDAAQDCPGGHVDLKGHGMLVDTRMEDQVLRLTMQGKSGKSEILTVDICSGKITGTLAIETDPGLVAE